MSSSDGGQADLLLPHLLRRAPLDAHKLVMLWAVLLVLLLPLLELSRGGQGVERELSTCHRQTVLA